MLVEARDVNAIVFSGEKEGVFILRVDFGLSSVQVRKQDDVLIFSRYGRIHVSTPLKDKFCYLVKRGAFCPVAFFDESTGKFYKLMPTRDWPSVTIGSVPMHRVRRVSPRRDTQEKIKLIKPYGVVLDTCMGLGYTAIGASSTSKVVYTFEKDKNIYFLAKINPLSRELFRSPNIRIKRGDIEKEIKKFPSFYFDCIIHDPPTFKISPHLYSVNFYRQLYRVLKRRGRMFHYAPFYGIKKGKDFPARVKFHLKEAGFKIVNVDYNVGGILCRRS